MEQIEEHIRELLNNTTDGPFTEREIAKAIGLRGKSGKRLKHILRRLITSGDIARVRGNCYALAGHLDLVTGRLDVAVSGTGFVNDPDADDDIMVPQRDKGTALPGDIVTVRIHVEKKNADKSRRRGKIIRIVERATRDIVGTLKATKKFKYVVPVDPSFKQDFYVESTMDAKINDRVVIRFTGWENKHVSPEAEIIEVLGPADKPSVDTISIIRHYGFSETFPEDVLKESESVAMLVNTPGKRMNLKDKFIFTIDPDKARDFDDAISLDFDENGNRILGVHIADVSHFVKRGSALDKEAASRGNSVYLPDKVIPMLPEQLSNGVCSLKPNEDRMAFTAFITFNASGAVIDRTFTKSVINSKLRLTYKEALKVLQGSEQVTTPEAAKLINSVHKLAQQLRKRRFSRHALSLDVPECEIVLDKDGIMTGLQLVDNDESHQLIEECMIAANEAVAFEVSNKGTPLIHRFHDKPSPEKIQDLTEQLVELGYKPGNLKIQKNLAMFLKSIKDDPLAYHIRVEVLRSMKRAIYSAENLGHYGLSKKYYAHFTSPIRRYADLVLHRQLQSILSNSKKSKYEKGLLNTIANDCSSTEQNAQNAERALIEIKKYRFLQGTMKRKKKPVYEAVIVKVVNFGMFVEIIDLQLQGMVHVKSISKKYVKFDQRKETLRAGKQVYGLGKKVRVVVSSVDFDKRRIDFDLV